MSQHPERLRKLFIGGLDYNVTEEDLRNYFGHYGELVDCVVERDKISGRSRGFGFVTYSDPVTVDAVQASRPHHLRGREVELKRAVPRKYFKDFGGHITVNRIFVGGLLDDTEVSDLRDYFSAFGTVRNVEILRDRETNRKRGFAFVEFDDYDHVDKIMLGGRHVIGGKTIDVRKYLSNFELNVIREYKYLRLRRDSIRRKKMLPSTTMSDP